VLAANEDLPGATSDFAQYVDTSNSSTASFNLIPRQLGDFYHCTQHDPLSQQSSLGGLSGKGAIKYTRTVPFGGPGQPVLVYSGAGWPWYPFVAGGGAPGWYGPTANWPSNPFPTLASNRRMRVTYAGGNGSKPVTFNGRIWEVQIPGQKEPPPYSFFGNESGYGSPPRGVTGVARNTWGYPGGPSEWNDFTLLVSWDEVHYLGRSPWAAKPWPGPKLNTPAGPSWLPSDLSALDMVDHPPEIPGPPAGYEALGGRLPYAVDSSALHTKNTGFFTDVNNNPAVYRAQDPIPSYVRTRSAITIGGAGTIPLNAVDDDCQGCEDCDLDGPVFFGAQPAGSQNYDGSGNLAAPDTMTVASAVFDNIVFINGSPDRRTDYPLLG
ncbi:MAG: hypothetical protein D6685_12650, partial [Bacteroidetes bacterium]